MRGIPARSCLVPALAGLMLASPARADDLLMSVRGLAPSVELGTRIVGGDARRVGAPGVESCPSDLEPERSPRFSSYAATSQITNEPPIGQGGAFRVVTPAFPHHRPKIVASLDASRYPRPCRR